VFLELIRGVRKEAIEIKKKKGKIFAILILINKVAFDLF
jgi:hypothetical protein